jgi:hypothetical protein
MEGEFTTGMRRIFERVGFTGEVMDRLLATRRNTSPADEAPVFTEALAARVQKLYARDFALFGYDPASWRGL